MPKQIIFNLLPKLSQSDLQELSTVVSTQLLSHDFSQLSQQIKEQRFVKGVFECPFCHDTHVVKNGTRHGIQRYLCRHCEKSFSSQTQTASAYSKKTPHVWLTYIECFLSGISLRKCAERCQIHLNTAFIWRHKLLEALKQDLTITQISGVIEADECYFRYNRKGERNLIKKSKDTPKKRGISHEQVAVGTALDRQGNLLMGLLGTGPTKYEPLKRLFEGRITPSSMLCTDSAKGYKQLAKELALTHIPLTSGKKKHDIYHINHINAMHHKLKSFMHRFKGVATKHLDHYLYYFKSLELMKHEKLAHQNQQIYLKTHATYSIARKSDIKLRKPAFI